MEMEQGGKQQSVLLERPGKPMQVSFTILKISNALLDVKYPAYRV
ncbi:hypothetical protein [Eikenella corrodens]|nr:hypothetical protein [Eikenella corrodens]